MAHLSRPHLDATPATGLIRVKMLFRAGQDRGVVEPEMLRRFPAGVPEWGRCRFIFDTAAREYDWLVVYDDLPPRSGERFSLGEEPLACPRAHTLVVTSEPSSIKLYGTGYLRQFGHVLTSQEPSVIHHPGAIFAQPALLWFYGRGHEHGAYDHMVASPPNEKTALISTVCSSKRQTHTLHSRRYDFVQELRGLIPELDVFGHGVRPIADKAEALDRYRYHIAIENHVCQHHWTEKLSDSFLGLCLPFYHGCPNAADYFPEESFIPIDINDTERAARQIKEAIATDAYARRLPAIKEARRLVLERYGLFATVSRLVTDLNKATTNTPTATGEAILSRRAWRKRHPLDAIAYAWEKTRIRLRRATTGSP